MFVWMWQFHTVHCNFQTMSWEAAGTVTATIERQRFRSRISWRGRERVEYGCIKCFRIYFKDSDNSTSSSGSITMKMDMMMMMKKMEGEKRILVLTAWNWSQRFYFKQLLRTSIFFLLIRLRMECFLCLRCKVSRYRTDDCQTRVLCTVHDS